jgi:hypothetical protein
MFGYNIYFNLDRGEYNRTIYSLFNFFGDVGGFFSVVWGFGFYLCLGVSVNTLNYQLLTTVYKTAFKFNLRDFSPCNKTKMRRALDRGLAKIDDELDVSNFIRFHLQSRGFFKQLLTSEKRKAARDLKYHLESG